MIFEKALGTCYLRRISVKYHINVCRDFEPLNVLEYTQVYNNFNCTVFYENQPSFSSKTNY